MKKILNSKWLPWNSWPSMAAVLFIGLAYVVYSGSQSTKTFDEEHGITRLPTGQRIYEVKHEGATYLVIEKHNSIGICQKAGEVVWTKEVKD